MLFTLPMVCILVVVPRETDLGLAWEDMASSSSAIKKTVHDLSIDPKEERYCDSIRASEKTILRTNFPIAFTSCMVLEMTFPERRLSGLVERLKENLTSMLR